MVRYCVAFGCKETYRKGNGIQFHKLTKRSFHYNVIKETQQNLTPLQRLQKFKRLKERQTKVQQKNLRKPGIKRVTFADEMTSEAIAVNGSHEPDVEKDEKILKPRKSILSNDQDKSVVQNGSNENGSVSENGDNDNVENGYDAETQNDEVSKPSKRSLRQKNLQEKRESTPNRQTMFREVKTVKESTPKPETPTKRELRQREMTPRKTTPKPETPSKRDLKSRGTPSKVNSSESNSEPKLVKNKDKQEGGSEQEIEETESPDTIQKIVVDKEINLKLEESVIVIEESTNEDNNVESFTESKDEIVVIEKPQDQSFFSAFRKSVRRSSLEIKDACEASSSSVICLDSPSLNGENIIPSMDIKGRKPINSFSRFPGRNVSITSIDKSLKRKAEESFEEEDRKRFAGETASGSEKSPGWRFFSPSFRTWSPSQSTKTHLSTSTPFHKREEQDSMAVNYDSKTKLDLDDSIENEDTLSSKQKANNKWCRIM